MDWKTTIGLGSLAISTLTTVAFCISFYVRSVTEIQTAKKLEELGQRLVFRIDAVVSRIDALKDEIARVAAAVMLNEERFIDVKRRISCLEAAPRCVECPGHRRKADEA